MNRYEPGLAVYFAKACHCRRGFMCAFCRSHRPRPQSRCVDCGERLTRPDSRNTGRCLEHRLYPVRQDLDQRCDVCGAELIRPEFIERGRCAECHLITNTGTSRD